MDPDEKKASREDAGADAVLQVGERLFPVQRRVLACHSQYFEAMFFGGARESAQRHILIRGVETEPLQALLDFLQTGTLHITRRNVASLLETADFLLLEGAKRRCETFLERELRVSNCLSFGAYAGQFTCRALRSAAVSVASTHWADVVAQAEFEQLPKEMLLGLLRSDGLFVPREDAVFDAILRWVAAGPEERERDFPELVDLVRVPFLSLPFLDRLVGLGKRPTQDVSVRLVKTLESCLPLGWMGPTRSPCAGRSYDDLYVLAGKHGKEQQQLFRYHPRTSTWHACSPLRRRNFTQYAVAAAGNFLFVTGGSFREDFFWSSVNWVSIYSSREDTWLEGPAMKKARSNHCAVGLGSRLYVMGGNTEEGVTPDVECLALADPAWGNAKPLVHPVERAGAVGVGRHIYVICGLDENGDVCPAVQQLDVETGLWEVVSSSPLPRYDLCVTTLNGAIYTVGGGTFRFDMDTSEWTPVEGDCLAGRFFTGCCTANGRIYLLAQRYGNGTIPNMVILDPYLDLCQEVDSKIPCPLPVHAAVSIRRFDTRV